MPASLAQAHALLARLPMRAARYGYAALRRATLRRLERQDRPIVLLFTHDLSRSGAPLLVVEMARTLRATGYAPLVLSPVAGPFAADLIADGLEIVIDPALRNAPYLQRLGKRSKAAVCNTVETAGLVAELAQSMPVLWYLHEVSLLQERLPHARAAIEAASAVWAGSAMCADILRPVRGDVEIVPYGLARIEGARPVASEGPFVVGVFGSIEPRKGQDFVVAARLPAEVQIRLYGRVLDTEFAADVLPRATGQVDYRGEVDLAGYQAALRDVDAVLVSSRDDTLPLVSIDALGAGRMLLLLPSVGTSAWLTDGKDALIASETSVDGVTQLIERALVARKDAAAIGAAASATFDREFSATAFRDRLLATLDRIAK